MNNKFRNILQDFKKNTNISFNFGSLESLSIFAEYLDNLEAFTPEPTMPSMGEMREKFESYINGIITDAELEFYKLTANIDLSSFYAGYQLALKEHGNSKKKSKWVKWEATGDSSCPIDGETLIKVKVICGDKGKGKAKIFVWSSMGSGSIIKYKVIKYASNL